MSVKPKPSSARWREWYAALKQHDHDVFIDAMRSAEGFTLTYNLPLDQGAELERVFIMFACQLCGVLLPPNPVELALMQDGT